MRKSYIVSEKYFLIPVKNFAPPVKLKIMPDDPELQYSVTVELGSWQEHDFTGCCVSPVPVGGSFAIEWEDEAFDPELHFVPVPPMPPDNYTAPERPVLHFTARCGWLNDPNGLFYLDGKWHLFYQHNPLGIWASWNQAHWGHAESRDLFHWQDTGVPALTPDHRGPTYSGSALIDPDNCSGVADGSQKTVLFYYTAAKRPQYCQCLAFSADGGRTLQKFSDNPLIPASDGDGDTRDPAVIFDRRENIYRMALYCGDSNRNHFAFYSSKDLLQWEKAGEIYFPDRECPGLAPIKAEGEDEEYILFHGGAGFYQLGRFENGVFKGESDILRYYTLPVEYDCFPYAGQFFAGAPDDRHIFIAWLFPPKEIDRILTRGMMTIPVEFRLRRFPEGLRICAEPVRELWDLIDRHIEYAAITEQQSIVFDSLSCSWMLEGEFPEKSDCSFEVCGIRWLWEHEKRLITSGKVEAHLPEGADRKFKLIFDSGAVELFAAGGRIWSPFTAPLDHKAPVLKLIKGTLTEVRLSHLVNSMGLATPQ